MSKLFKDLKYFLSPRSIAIIGASGNFESISGKPVLYLKKQGYEGRVYPINPKYEELCGYQCYKSVLDVPGSIDLALVAVNYKLVLPMLKQCVVKGIPFASIFSSGFAESGEEGKELQNEIARLAKDTGMGICGPNCQGSVSLKDRAIGGFSASLGVVPLITGPIGYVTQSGALGYSIFSLAQESGVGFSYVASTGNEVDLHTLDFMEFMLEDNDTTMVISYLEGIKNGKQFMRLADRALKLGKPIVALKVGRSEVGQKAASSHTASLTGSDAVVDAFFKQKGIIRVNDIENMIDIAALMQRIPELPKGDGIGLITTSGGGGILMADEAADMGLNIPELDEKTTNAIREVIPAYGSALNPVDVTAQVINEADDFMKVLQVMLDNADIDALVIVITQIAGESGKQMARDIVKISKQTSKPITVAWTTGDNLVGEHLKILSDGGVQYYKSPVRAVRAMGVLMKYATFRKEYQSHPKHVVSDDKSKKLRDSAIALCKNAKKSLTEHQGKELLDLYGIRITNEDVAISKENAVDIAQEIGYPVVMKIDSPDILHKTEAGGLKLNIQTDKAVEEVYDEIMENARNYNPNAQLSGVLIQEMVKGGTEVIVGLNNDPQFGPTIMFGLGGIFVEILKDVSLRVAPVNYEEAIKMIQEIKGFKILEGARGQSKYDINAIADVLVKVSRMAIELEDVVAELDINPLIVMPEGQGIRVADALIIKK
ncbi:MAG: acetate--CoA ligase family protein [Bacteroidetes bacterium]|nr:acetate--CoA ligase family protein [Bacteroidota bacterium]MBL6963637.1 acetate--CoA ligase family protein [Bacteroidota bacterium]